MYINFTCNNETNNVNIANICYSLSFGLILTFIALIFTFITIIICFIALIISLNNKIYVKQLKHVLVLIIILINMITSFLFCLLNLGDNNFYNNYLVVFLYNLSLNGSALSALFWTLIQFKSGEKAMIGHNNSYKKNIKFFIIIVISLLLIDNISLFLIRLIIQQTIILRIHASLHLAIGSSFLLICIRCAYIAIKLLKGNNDKQTKLLLKKYLSIIVVFIIVISIAILVAITIIIFYIENYYYFWITINIVLSIMSITWMIVFMKLYLKYIQ